MGVDGGPDEPADGIDRSHLEAASRHLTGDAISRLPHLEQTNLSRHSGTAL
jgi:hypothetical protein